MGLLEIYGIGSGAGNLGAEGGFRQGPVCGGSRWCDGGVEEGLYGVYIDNLCALALVPWSHSNSAKAPAADPSQNLSVGRAEAYSVGNVYSGTRSRHVDGLGAQQSLRIMVGIFSLASTWILGTGTRLHSF